MVLIHGHNPYILCYDVLTAFADAWLVQEMVSNRSMPITDGVRVRLKRLNRVRRSPC